MIEKFFEKIINLKKEKIRSLRKLEEAIDSFNSISGMSYKEISVSGTPTHKDFGDMMGDIEMYEKTYKEIKNSYDYEYNLILRELNKLDTIDREILEMFYIEEKTNKEILSNLSKYYNKNYSDVHFKRIKRKAEDNLIMILK